MQAQDKNAYFPQSGLDLHFPHEDIYSFPTLYLICQFWALPIQQHKKDIGCQKYGQMGIQLSDFVEKIVGKEEIARYEQFFLFPQSFQKLSVVDTSK